MLEDCECSAREVLDTLGCCDVEVVEEDDAGGGGGGGGGCAFLPDQDDDSEANMMAAYLKPFWDTVCGIRPRKTPRRK